MVRTCKLEDLVLVPIFVMLMVCEALEGTCFWHFLLTSIIWFAIIQMVLELNRMLEGFIDEDSARESAPTYREPNGFLKNVIIPLFEVVQAVSSLSHRLQKEKIHLN